MKNTVRAHRHDGKTSTSPQAQKPTAPAAAVPAKHYALSLNEWTEGDPVITTTLGEIDISREDLDVLNKNSVQAGDHVYHGESTFTNLLNIGLKAMMTTPDSSELENATWTSNALLMLLSQNMDYERLHGGNFCGNGKDSGPLSMGLQQLVWQTQERLVRASNMGVAS